MDEKVQAMGRRDDPAERVSGDDGHHEAGPDVYHPGARRVLKAYAGTVGRTGGIVRVLEAGVSRPLDPRYDLANHSPDGFSWGYSGSGPSQLSLALVADAIGDDEVALDTYLAFRDAVVVFLDRDSGFEMTVDDVLDEVERIRRLSHMSWGADDLEVHDG